MIRDFTKFVPELAANSVRYCFALIAAIALATSALPAAHGQDCPGEWRKGDGFAGVNSSIAKSIVWTPAGGQPTLVVAGSFTIAGDVKSNYVAAWDGTSWHAVGQNLTAAVTAMTANNADLYVATGKSIYKLNGNTWQILGSQADGNVRDLLWWDGALHAGGEFTTLGGPFTRSCVARWNGTSWTNVGNTSSGNVQVLGHYNGQLIAGGSLIASQPNGARVVGRWDGTNWLPLGTNLNGIARAFLVDGTDLIVAGSIIIPGGPNTRQVARWNGSTWSAMGTGIDTQVYTLAADEDGILLAGQRSGDDGSGPYRWNGTSWSPMASELPNSTADLYSICIFQGRTFVSGTMQTAGSSVCSNIAAWDGLEWSPLGTAGFSGAVLALAEYRGTLVAGGTFRFVNQEPVECVAILDGSDWRPLGTGLTSVSAFCVDNDELFATGRSIDGSYYCFWWSGFDWVALGGPFSLNSFLPTLNAVTVFDGKLIVGGQFDFAAETAANHIAAWNGFRWESLGDGVRSSENYDCIEAEVNALVVHEGDLFVGGSFDTAGDANAELVARWNGSDWSAVGSGITGVRCTAKVHALASHDGELVASGDFIRAGTQVASYGITHWNGSQWLAFSPSVPPSDTKIALFSWKHKLYAGTVRSSTYPNRQRVLEWNGSQWNQLGAGITDGQVDAFAALHDTLYVGGAFRTAGEFVSANLARWDVPQNCCASDLNSDLLVDDSDFQLFVVAYNILDCGSPEMAAGCPSDLNGDGAVDDTDFTMFLAAYNALICQ